MGYLNFVCEDKDEEPKAKKNISKKKGKVSLQRS